MYRLAILLTLALCSCDDTPSQRTAPLPAPSDPAPVATPDSVDIQASRASASLSPVGGSGIEGAVTLTRVDGGVRVQARLNGVEVNRFYALQVLLGRSCRADPDVHLGAELGRPHGTPYQPASQRHLGDLGNVRGDDSRTGRYDRIDTVLPLSGTSSAAGRAVVLRAARDDGSTAPAGRSGDVLACGVFSGGPA